MKSNVCRTNDQIAFLSRVSVCLSAYMCECACLCVCGDVLWLRQVSKVKEICKRSACFLNKCIFSSSCLVRSIMLYSINFGRYNSVIYRNLCTVCKLFNWSVHDYISNRVCLTRRYFTAYYKSRLPADESITVLLALCLNCWNWETSTWFSLASFIWINLELQPWLVL